MSFKHTEGIVSGSAVQYPDKATFRNTFFKNATTVDELIKLNNTTIFSIDLHNNLVNIENLVNFAWKLWNFGL